MQVRSLLEANSADFDTTMDVNARGVFLCYAAAARQMVKQGKGKTCLDNAYRRLWH
jgi:meso-butanediol dehydrogenase/(S,S)-butanediol dehydrogenase/diacetyl reductase